jgi:hypothetical protein
MYVIGQVARNTGCAHWRGIFAFWCRLLVATFARNLDVRTIKLVGCAFVVVEVPHRPAPRVMAILALNAEL